jgi:hypothetical protein
MADIAVTRWREDARPRRHRIVLFVRDDDSRRGLGRQRQPAARWRRNATMAFDERRRDCCRDATTTSPSTRRGRRREDVELRRVEIENLSTRRRRLS